MPNNSLLEGMFNTADGVFAVDEEQRIIFWNRGAEAVLGYSADEVADKHCFELFCGIDEAGRTGCTVGCGIIRSARQGKLCPGQNLRVRCKAGTALWLSVIHSLVGAGDDRCAALVHIFRDVTAEVEAKRLMTSIAEQISGYGHIQGTEGARPAQETLTEREKQVLGLLAVGDGTASIARKLTISNTTARNHIQNILAKLGVHTRLEAVAYARHQRRVEPTQDMPQRGRESQI